MADDQEMAVETPEDAVVEEVVEEITNPMDALKIVIKDAIKVDGLRCGLNQAVRALDSRRAQLCCLAEDCDEESYTKLVKAICTEHNIDLVSVPSKMDLGQWCGLCKLDDEGEARKVVKCSCAVLTHLNQESTAWAVLKDHLEKSE